MRFHVITLFPESFDSYVSSSIIGRAVHNGKIKINFYNPRNFASPAKSQTGKQKPYLRVDDKPYGGGPGMVMQAPAVIKAVEKAVKKTKTEPKIIFFSPSGKNFDTKYAKKLAEKHGDIIFISGRYEGVDARVYKIFKNLKFKIEKLSIGPYVLTGGELPTMVVMDSVARQIRGVLGKMESIEENRVASSEVYTRPEVLTYPSSKLDRDKSKKYRVPKVLLSGNHAKIEEWRKSKRSKN